MRSVLACCFTLGLLACKADIPDGAYRCDVDTDCPDGFKCRARDAESELFCFAHPADAGPSGGDAHDGAIQDGSPADGVGHRGDDAGADAGTGPGEASGFEVHSASFWNGGDVRSAGRFAVHEDGFDRGQRLCTAGRELCVTGGFTP